MIDFNKARKTHSKPKSMTYRLTKFLSNGMLCASVQTFSTRHAPERQDHMTTSKHTTGPWRMSRIELPPIGWQPNGEPWPTNANGKVFWGYSISGSSKHGAAILPTLAAVHNFPDQIEANAHLIVAAPDMYAALKAIDAFWTEAHPAGPDGDPSTIFGMATLTDETLAVWRAIRAAISVAEGAST